MKPTRLLLNWLGVLLGLGILLGAASALQFKVPDTLHSVAWGLLLALLLLAMLDAMRLRRRPSPRVQRQMPGSLALGRWGEVRLALEHDFLQPLTVRVFDHVPDGLNVEDMPQAIELRPGERSDLGYRLRPLRRGHFSFSRCEIHLPSPMGLWSARRSIEVSDTTRVYPDFARLYGAQLLGVDNWLRIRRPQSSMNTICWSRSSWYSRAMGVRCRAVAFQSIWRRLSPSRNSRS